MSNEPTRVIVATDFSAASAAAVMRAAQIVRRCRGELELMHVIPYRDMPFARTLGLDESVRQTGTEAVAAAESLAVSTGARFGIRVRAHVGLGIPHTDIAARAQATHADLLVVGAHGQRGWRATLLGTTAQRLHEVARTPLLIVRGDSIRRYARAVVGVDFSRAAAEASRAASVLFPDTAFHFLHVCNELFDGRLLMAGVPEGDVAAYRNQALLRASRELEGFIAVNDLQHRRGSARVRHGYPPACIHQAAAEVDASLIVLGATGKSRLAAGLLGSVSRQVVSGARHDILVARASASHRSGSMKGVRHRPAELREGA